MTFPSFTTGEVLTAADMNAVGLWLVKTQTIGTAVSSVVVNDVFSATYDNYKIIVSGGVASANGPLGLHCGSTSADHYLAFTGVVYSTGVANLANDNGTNSWTRAGYGSTSTLYMNLDLLQPFLTENTIFNGSLVAMNTASVGGFAGGFRNNTTSYTSFTITPASGTLTGGTICVYGYRN